MNWQGPLILAVPLARRMLDAQQVLQPTLPLDRSVHRNPLARMAAAFDLQATQGLLRFTTAANDAAQPVEQA